MQLMPRITLIGESNLLDSMLKGTNSNGEVCSTNYKPYPFQNLNHVVNRSSIHFQPGRSIEESSNGSLLLVFPVIINTRQIL